MHDESHRISRRAAIAIAAGTLFTSCKSSEDDDKTMEVKAPPKSVNGCQLIAKQLSPLIPCMESCGPDHPRDEWNHSCIHPHTAIYSCGRLYVPGNPNEHNHAPEEVALCEDLSNEAATILKGVKLNISESSSSFAPFFITANLDVEKQKKVTAELIRSAFNGAIYPNAKIIVANLEENSPLWESFVWSKDDVLEEKYVAWISKWRELISWFAEKDQLHSPVFVEVGDGEKLSDVNFGCVFPRLAVGLTDAGSLVGVCAHSVQT